MTSPHFSEKDFVVLDASIWVSRLIAQDEFHSAVKSWMEQQCEAGVQFVSPALLLGEVGGAISRQTGDPALGKRTITQLESLPGLRLVEMDNELVYEAACLAAELGLRGVDSIYVAVARQLNLMLVTFDVDQRERAQARISIRSIGE